MLVEVIFLMEVAITFAIGRYKNGRYLGPQLRPTSHILHPKPQNPKPETPQFLHPKRSLRTIARSKTASGCCTVDQRIILTTSRERQAEKGLLSSNH
jgi:hypothetical protein